MRWLFPPTLAKRLIPNRFFRQLKRDYSEVFGSEAGKRVLQDILIHSGYGTDAFVPGSGGEHTAYHVGKQWIALHIHERMHKTEKEIEQVEREMERLETESAERGV